MQDIPYINKLPENFKIKKEDIIYVHRDDPNQKIEFRFGAPTLKLDSEEFSELKSKNNCITRL